MLELFRDQIWNFIAVFIALVVFIVNLVLHYVQQERKALSYKVVSHYPLISMHHGFDKVEVLYENKPVKNINVIVVQVFNAGNVSILPDDFKRDLTFDFGDQSQILTAEIIEQNPSKLNAELKEITINSNPEVVTKLDHPINKVALLPLLLNEKWGVTIRFLVREFDEVNIDGLVVDVQDIREVTQRVTLSIIFKLGGIVIVVMFLLAIMSSILVGVGFTGIGTTLLIGFIVGFIFSTFLGLVLGQIQRARRGMNIARKK